MFGNRTWLLALTVILSVLTCQVLPAFPNHPTGLVNLFTSSVL